MAMEDRMRTHHVLYTGVDLYCDHVESVMASQDQNKVRLGIALKLDFPRALFEVGFFEGQVSWIQEALNLDPTLVPQLESKVHVLDKVQGESVSFGQLQYSKPQDEVSWQEWRLKTINSGGYHQATFPSYLNSEFRMAHSSEGIVHSNVDFEVGETGGYRLCRDEISTDILFQVDQKTQLPAYASHHYRYHVTFPKTLTGDLTKLLLQKR